MANYKSPSEAICSAKIESGIKVPGAQYNQAAQDAGIDSHIRKMKVGDSMFLKCENNSERATLCSMIFGRGPVLNMSFISRKAPGGVRVWRKT